MISRRADLRRNRHSVRLAGYDYSSSGAYFVTIGAQDRALLFGVVEGADMRLNEIGAMIQTWWLELNRRFPTLKTDSFVVMPNHVHGVILLTKDVGADLCVGPSTGNVDSRPPRTKTAASLPAIVQWFKTMTTNEYLREVQQSGWPPFRRRLWQRSYHDHIVRSPESLDRIRRYIADNPSRWSTDRENPEAVATEPADTWAEM